jgi:spermidine synthase
MTAVLCLAFFLSGAAALIFETLWFRQAGLMLGNSVWASSIVLAAFMAGLAAGNAWAARSGAQLRRPVFAYAILEVLIGVTGLGMVLLFPALPGLVAPWLRPLVSSPWLLNSLRMTLAFALLLVPSAAMGATLPLLVRALVAHQPSFGRVLGLLYGWNTMGAVAGALSGDALLLEPLGVKGTGLAAALCNGLAAVTALLAARGRSLSDPSPGAPGSPAPKRTFVRPLLAAFVSGGTLLALEVVWFRFLLLFFPGSGVTFAYMLAAVLLGVAAGGLVASRWLKADGGAARHAALLALGAGMATVVTYSAFRVALGPERVHIFDYRTVFALSLALMFPVALLSGMLFTLVGDALKPALGEDARAAGLLTLVNTIGAAMGASLGGLVLLPALGIERSLFLLCLMYALVALLLAPSGTFARPARGRFVPLSAALGYLAVMAFFPFGLVRNDYVERVARRWKGTTGRVTAYREGLSETIFYVRNDRWGRPLSSRLVTNGHSMSDTGLRSKRYMRLFVHLPVALRPDARKALLISFGLGSTAQALTDTSWLEHIDVVDISRDILEMGRIVFPSGQYPLDDARVRVHVEDGRFFLLTTAERYDIITAEPPPPKNAGVVNLYTREYFRLVHDRLADQGIATHWLPTYQMTLPENRAITRAFCDVFEDCSLWSGSGLEWMLVGSRGLRGPAAEDAFSRQWKDPVLVPWLRDIGIELPEQLGTLFIADAAFLREWTRSDQPLDDAHPYRLSYRYLDDNDMQGTSMMDASLTRRRFEQSAYIRLWWPPALRERTLEQFDAYQILTAALFPDSPSRPPADLSALDDLLTRTRLRTPVLWLMGSTFNAQRAADEAVADGVHDPGLDEVLGHRAMAERDFRRADELLARSMTGADPVHASRILRWRALALELAGDRERAQALVRESMDAPRLPERDRREWEWLARRLQLEGSR